MTDALSPELLVYGFTTPSEPQISPDGTRIVYTLSKTDQETKKSTSDVWVCDIDGGNARRLTWNGEHNSGARWSSDGSRIAFVSDRVKKSGIFLLDTTNPGEARELTRHMQGISDLAWSPDGASIAYTTMYDPENPDEQEEDPEAPAKVRVTRRIDYKQDGRGYLNDVRMQVFAVDVESGERRMITHDPVDHLSPRWSPDGSMLALQVLNRNGMCSQLGVVSVETGEMKLIGPEDGVVESWSWSPSGDRIIFAGDTSRSYKDDFFVYQVASGDLQRLTRDLHPAPVSGESGDAPTDPIWLDERRVLFHARQSGASAIYDLDAETGAVEPVHQCQANLSGFSTDDSRRYIVQGYTSLDTVGEISVFDVKENTARLITNYGAAVLADHRPAQWERFEVERDGFTTEAWLLKPNDFDPNKKYPAILEIHGGPNWFFGHRWEPLHQCLATNGFVVVFSNPRGSTSYGPEFTQQVIGDWGGEDFKDLMAVMDKVCELPYVDAARTGVSGYSYGGYMTSWIIGQTDRFKAAVCGAPCFDLESMYGTSDIAHFFGDKQWGGAPHHLTEWYEQHSPSNYAHRAVTPTLIVHGEADERCPIGQGEQMFVALNKAGCEVEFARYPGGSHMLVFGGQPAHREDILARSLAWFKDHLGEPM